MTNKLYLSVVIPVYNEKDSIRLLYEKLKSSLSNFKDYEIIFIDDGSKDNSFEVIKQIAINDKRVKAIQLKKNFGQTIAISAGFDHAGGKVIVTMDADLQNDPEDIPKLITKLEEGYDVVSGWRKTRKDPLSKRMPSRVANKIISLVTGIKLHDFGCTLKAYRSEIIKNLKLYGEMHRFLPAYAQWAGAKIAEVEVKHHPRSYGQTKYGLARTPSVIIDLITTKFLIAFSTKPSHIFGALGLILILTAMLLSLFITIRKFCFGGEWVSPLIFIITICFITGIQFILMGLLGEISIRTYHESQNKSPYLISQFINKD
ncbi:MAG: glycosyltransferase family 2 protein [Candidatus Omnitrophica bacterium]|nr:glycosyltransferase family 2 protein [Candidatus Omnitrophota bacterium]